MIYHFTLPFLSFPTRPSFLVLGSVLREIPYLLEILKIDILVFVIRVCLIVY